LFILPRGAGDPATAPPPPGLLTSAETVTAYGPYGASIPPVSIHSWFSYVSPLEYCCSV
jgi:hypothetical protein